MADPHKKIVRFCSNFDNFIMKWHGMAYVELEGDEKPRFVRTLVRDLDHSVISDFSMYMDPKLAFKDYRALAGEMGYKWVYVKNLDMEKHPSEELLRYWSSGPGSKTVTDLIKLLEAIERHDVIEILSPVEYTIEQPKRRRPFSTASGSSYKEATEHTMSMNSSTRSDEELDRHQLTSISFPSSEPPGSYKSTTDNGEEYDTDEELNHKINMLNNEPTQTDDSSHYPVFLYRDRVSSSGSTSTAGSACTNYSHVSVSRKSLTVETIVLTDESNVRSTQTDVYPQPQMMSPIVADLPPTISTMTATDKVALLIGNRNYSKLPDEPPLCFPHKDVYDFRFALEELDFTVLSLVDLTLTEMRTVMLAFQKLLGAGAFAVFYFAGHGYEENGKNYLMPVDASPLRAAHEFIVAQEILLEMQLKKTALNLVIIDTCRVKGVNINSISNNSNSLRKGCFGNTIIAYSCQSQMPAFEHQDQRNGVYMTELKKRIKEDRRIEHILMDVNTAVNGNPRVIQRPVFESDTIVDCRLTSPKVPDSDFDRVRTERWIAATTPPEPQIFPREEEKLEFRLEYKNCFCNTLQIDVFLKNYNSCFARIDNIALLNGEDLPVQANSISKDVSPIQEHNQWQQVQQYRIRDLQKIRNKLLLVLQLVVSLTKNDEFLGSQFQIEFKLNADFPLVSSCLNDFREWIMGDSLRGHGKNTWV